MKAVAKGAVPHLTSSKSAPGKGPNRLPTLPSLKPGALKASASQPALPAASAAGRAAGAAAGSKGAPPLARVRGRQQHGGKITASNRDVLSLTGLKRSMGIGAMAGVEEGMGDGDEEEELDPWNPCIERISILRSHLEGGEGGKGGKGGKGGEEGGGEGGEGGEKGGGGEGGGRGEAEVVPGRRAPGRSLLERQRRKDAASFAVTVDAAPNQGEGIKLFKFGDKSVQPRRSRPKQPHSPKQLMERSEAGAREGEEGEARQGEATEAKAAELEAAAMEMEEEEAMAMDKGKSTASNPNPNPNPGPGPNPNPNPLTLPLTLTLTPNPTPNQASQPPRA